MPVVGFGESTRYALRLYGYVLGVLVAGGAGVGVGAALLWPEVRAWRGPREAALAPGVAGGVLVFVGLSVVAVGLLASAYKLLADAAEAGGRATDTVSDDRSSPPDPGDAGTTGESDFSETSPPEPSPSEIAFGSDGVDDGSLPGGDGADDPLRDRSE